MTAIVRDEPPPLEDSGVAVPPGIARVIDHCLEKNPDERFQSARDLAFDLRALSDLSGPRVSEARAALDVAPRPRRLAAFGLLAFVTLGAVAATAFFAGRRSVTIAPPTFDKLTFRQGSIIGARFGPDARSVFYSASWGGAPAQTFLAQPGKPESRPLDLPLGASLLSVSKAGDLALMLNPQFIGGFIFVGTLARAPAGGGAPRELLENVEDADWGPDGESIAVVRTVGGRGRLEFPIGSVLFETGGWIQYPRVALDGDAVAFVYHPARGNDGGDVVLVDRRKQATTLARGFQSLQGLAWTGDDILFTGTRSGSTRLLYSVSRDGGDSRLVASGTGSMIVYDATREGQALVARTSDRIGLAVRRPGDKDERDMSWLDWTLLRDLSADGKMVAFDETGEGGGPAGTVYLRPTDGSAAVRLGDGVWPMLSPDGKWVTCVQGDPPGVVMLPTGAGESRRIAAGRVTPLAAFWFPDGRRLLVTGNEPGRGVRYYVVPVTGGDPKPVTPEGSSPFARAISPDGRYVLTMGPDRTFALFPIDGGVPLPVKGLGVNDVPLQMASADTAYVYDHIAQPMPVFLVDLKTGTRTRVMTVGAGRSADTGQPFTLRISADARTYAFSYSQSTSELFLMRKGQ